MLFRHLTFTFLFIVFISPSGSEAGVETFIKEYTYQASEMDSKISCRINALVQVKRLLLEEIGTYMVSRTVVENAQVVKDEISVLTAGIVKTRIKEETWDGKQYWLRAEIQVDPDDVNKKIERFRSDWDKKDELEAVHQKMKIIMTENEVLKKELQGMKDQVPPTRQIDHYKQNMDKIKAFDLYLQAMAMYENEDFQNAIALLQKSIELNPSYQQAYEFIGRCFFESGQNDLAKRTAKDILKRDFNPTDPETYAVRGFAYHVLNKEAKAVKEFALGIELNPKYTRLYRTRSHSLSKLHRLGAALDDINKAIQLEPDDYRNYMIRGGVYGRGKFFDKSMADFDTALKMNPKSGKTYFMRGAIYKYAKKEQLPAIRDFKKACALGFYMACDHY